MAWVQHVLASQRKASAEREVVLVDEEPRPEVTAHQAAVAASWVSYAIAALMSPMGSAVLAEVTELDKRSPGDEIAAGRGLADDGRAFHAAALVAVEPAANLVLSEAEQRRRRTRDVLGWSRHSWSTRYARPVTVSAT